MKDVIASDSCFTKAEIATLTQLAGMIIPASAEFDLPGADDALVLADIVESGRRLEEDIRAGIEFAQEQDVGSDAEACAQAGAVTTQLEGRPEMAPIVTLVMQCYYRDDRVMRALEMEARPPFPTGYAVDEGDWSMLEEVQARGKIWREV